MELFNAVENNNIELLEKLLQNKNIDVNYGNFSGYTALILASICGNTHCVEALIKKGANVNIQNKNGWTALMKASRWVINPV